jgi:hypothetical protein
MKCWDKWKANCNTCTVSSKRVSECVNEVPVGRYQAGERSVENRSIQYTLFFLGFVYALASGLSMRFDSIPDRMAALNGLYINH